MAPPAQSIGPERPRRLLPVAAGPRMRVLLVLSSAQGGDPSTERAALELMARLAERVAFEVALDGRDPDLAGRIAAFGRGRGIPVHVGPPADLPGLLGRDDWDLIEASSWVAPATNAAILRGLGDRALAYTPRYDPDRGPATTPEAAAFADDIHHRMARRADVVLCLTPRERRIVQAQTHGRNNCLHLPDGLDTAAVPPGPVDRPPRLLHLGRGAGPASGLARVLAILPRLLANHPDLKLVLLGPDCDRGLALVPPDLRAACEPWGDLPEPGRRRALAEGLGLILLDDAAPGGEALEALGGGTPVFLPEGAAARSLFDGHRGVKFCPPDDPDATFEVIDHVLAQGPAAILETLAGRDRLRAAFDWDVLALRKWQALAAAWFTRHHVDRPFQGPAVARSAIAPRGHVA